MINKTLGDAQLNSKQQGDSSAVSCTAALQLALQIRQAALKGCSRELDRCVKQIGCDDHLGRSVAKASQAALRDSRVSVEWIPRSHDLSGTLLLLRQQWAAAFCSAPDIAPEGMSLRINDIPLR